MGRGGMGVGRWLAAAVVLLWSSSSAADAVEGGRRLDAPAPMPRPEAQVPAPPPAPRPPADADADGGRSARRERLAPDPVPGHRFLLDVQPFASEAIAGLLLIPEWLYRSSGGLWIRGRLGPVGLAMAGADPIPVYDSLILVGWEGRLFAIGGGPGLAYARLEDDTRRGEGMVGTVTGRVRVGALDGLHFMFQAGVGWFDSDPLVATVSMRLRVPLHRGRLLDFELAAGPPLSYAYGFVALELPLGSRDAPWRIRPHIGFTEVIDQVGRDGGPGLSPGATLVYRLQ